MPEQLRRDAERIIRGCYALSCRTAVVVRLVCFWSDSRKTLTLRQSLAEHSRLRQRCRERSGRSGAKRYPSMHSDRRDASGGRCEAWAASVTSSGMRLRSSSQFFRGSFLLLQLPPFSPLASCTGPLVVGSFSARASPSAAVGSIALLKLHSASVTLPFPHGLRLHAPRDGMHSVCQATFAPRICSAAWCDGRHPQQLDTPLDGVTQVFCSLLSPQ